MKKVSGIILLVLFFCLQGFTQNLSTSNKKCLHLYQLAGDMAQQRNFDVAKDALYQAIEKDPNFVEAYLRLGSIHLVLGDKDKAKNALKKAVELRPNSPSLAATYATMGEFYFKDRDYDQAKIMFQKVLDVKTEDMKLTDYAERMLESCAFAANALKNPIEFKPVKMTPTINNYYAQWYPILTADQQTMIYYVIRTNEKGVKGDIMVSKKESGNWTLPVSISENINTVLDEGAPTLSADGKTLVFASCNRPDAVGGCDLYVSYYDGGEWSVPLNMGKNVNSQAWDSEPSLSADGRTLYFASERKGGRGSFDIWYSTKNEKGEWVAARNIGTSINTAGGEVSPFIHANGTTLYFCSNYHPGMGGYDIFYTQKKDSSWSKPVNIGYPINTYEDEGTIFITADGKKGFYSLTEKKFASNNPPSYIYEFGVPESIRESSKTTYAKGTVYDASNKNKLGAKIELIDLKTNQVVQSVNSDSKNGDYLLVLTEGKEYALYVSKEGYLFKSSFFDYKNPSAFDPLALDIYLDPVKAGASVVLNNIFFATNSFELEDKSKTELDKIIMFMKINPTVNIELGGHTDDVGSDVANTELSQKRAKSVLDYLVKAGVNTARLKYKGYGETKPMLPNTSDDNRAKNRRIEFKIL